MKIIKIIFGLTKITAGAVFGAMVWFTLTSDPSHSEDDVYKKSQEMYGTKINEEVVTGADLNREESEKAPMLAAVFGLFAVSAFIWGGRDLYSLKS